ncbi:hypothetical protein BST43_15235 [Mycobacteroides saopaulense]|uniref:Uncharacterized protein n=1 Tax=Mycobacteroides saopaulense TaxID=1578165 RepID=A0A1X0J0Z1_9MYCO|nr:hypothetical protein [Mycobacteroides saopaulense]ORB55223.1 hypothetical protein BST43_15235 [Mycobacteroides saopaulense]
MQKPTKAFADMIAETADKLEAVLVEMYPDSGSHDSLMVTPMFLRRKADKYRQIADQDTNKALAYLQSRRRAQG